jgi:hypothetical protein
MGDEFIRDYAKRFKHRRDKAYQEELNTRQLFDGQGIVELGAVHCMRVLPETAMLPGDKLFVDASPPDKIRILKESSQVGYVMAEDVRRVSSLFDAEPRAHNLVDAELLDLSPDGSFSITYWEPAAV